MRKTEREIILKPINSLGTTQLGQPDSKMAFLLEAGLGQGMGAGHLYRAFEAMQMS